jgi:hypothetical protein
MFNAMYYLFALPGWELGLKGSNMFRTVAESFLMSFLAYLIPEGIGGRGGGAAVTAYRTLFGMLNEAVASGPAVSSVGREVVAFNAGYSATIWLTMAFMDIEGSLPN